MRIIRNPEQTGACVLVLGMFDGVHRGHQALLMRGAALAGEYGLPLNVCTFEPHPLAVLRPELAPARLTTQTERAQLMAGFGVDNLCVMTFTRDVADQVPEDFMADMVRTFAPKCVVCGFNFTFGRAGKGTGDMLRAYGADHGFETVIVPEVILEGATVSSTRIRRLLEAGRIPEVSCLMGHAYTLSGTVKEIDSHAPAAPMTVPRNKALPASGAYACYLTVGGQNYPALAFVDGGVEVWALDSVLVLKGRQVRLTFMKQLRETPEIADCREQLARDAAQARQFFFSIR